MSLVYQPDSWLDVVPPANTRLILKNMFEYPLKFHNASTHNLLRLNPF